MFIIVTLPNLFIIQPPPPRLLHVVANNADACAGCQGDYHEVLKKRIDEQGDISEVDLDNFIKKLPHVVDIDPGMLYSIYIFNFFLAVTIWFHVIAFERNRYCQPGEC